MPVRTWYHKEKPSSKLRRKRRVETKKTSSKIVDLNLATLTIIITISSLNS